jgi:hypothetical protein
MNTKLCNKFPNKAINCIEHRFLPFLFLDPNKYAYSTIYNKWFNCV